MLGFARTANRETEAFVGPETVSEVPDWRREKEARAAEIGLRLPRWYPPAEIEIIQMAPAATVEEYLESMLAPDAAAAQFIAWLRSTGRAGRKYTSEELDVAYGIHCQERNRVPTPMNQLRKFMKGHGITKGKDDVKAHGKRSRPTVWTISETVSKRGLAA